jgi:Flp pilus assembly protein TadG
LADRRRDARTPEPTVIAYFWTGAEPIPHRLRDVSLSGAYMYTAERWYLGTMLQLTLDDDRLRTNEMQKPGQAGSVTLWSKVVRHGSDGVGLEFLFAKRTRQKEWNRFLSGIEHKDRVNGHSPSDHNGERGQSLVEFALLFPLLFLLIVNAVNFGGFLYAWITVANSARAGAEYALLGGAVATAPATPTAAQVTALITNDVASLPNRASLQVRVCINRNSTVTCTGTGSGTTPTDPEQPLYVLTAVDVTYTYQPFIPLWEMPGLSIHATLPPTTIHRTAVMRIMQ